MRGTYRRAWVWGLAVAMVAVLAAAPASAAPVDGGAPSWEQMVDTVVGFVGRLLGSDTTTATFDVDLEGTEESTDEVPPTDPPPNAEGGPDWDPNG